MLDLTAVARAQLRADPYEWAYVPNAIGRGNAARLLATFPDEGFWALNAHDGEKLYRYSARPLVLLGADHPALADSLHPAWLGIATQLLSSDYRQALTRLTGRSLDGALMEAGVWRWGPDAQLGPHLDLASKIVTQVFYLNVGWDGEWGGCLRILRSRRPDDAFCELPPALGSSSVLVRSDHSWHSVTPVSSQAAAERLSLIVTWLHPGYTSPAWGVDDDGGVVPVGGGTRKEPAYA